MKYLLLLISVLMFPVVSANADQAMTPDQAKTFVKNAVIYVLENKDPNMDYSKYVSKDFINPIDGNTFNYDQWVAHQKHIKGMVKSMVPTFDLMVAEGDQVAAIYHIVLTKNDGSSLIVKDMAFFKIKDNKIVYCEELTRLVQGDQEDKNIGSTK